MDNFNPHYFLFKLPLYTKIALTSENFDAFNKLYNFGGSINEFSISLRENTTYNVVQNPYANRARYPVAVTEFYGVKAFKLSCVRTLEEMHVYAELLVDGKNIFLRKIGQTPSIADFEVIQVKDYSPVLSPEDQKEFVKAIGLAAHGVGIGSFVYLRRIFERFIENAYQKSKLNEGWDDDAYQRSRMDGKIKLLQGELPQFLYENRQLYGILSKGIHELSENDCLEHFEVVKLGIEMILDERLENHNRERKIASAKALINNAAQKLK